MASTIESIKRLAGISAFTLSLCSNEESKQLMGLHRTEAFLFHTSSLPSWSSSSSTCGSRSNIPFLQKQQQYKQKARCKLLQKQTYSLANPNLQCMSSTNPPGRVSPQRHSSSVLFGGATDSDIFDIFDDDEEEKDKKEDEDRTADTTSDDDSDAKADSADDEEQKSTTTTSKAEIEDSSDEEAEELNKVAASSLFDMDDPNDEFEDHIPQLNIVNLVGRTTWNPEPRYFDDGKVVVNVGLAVKRKYHPLERKVKNIPYGQEETDYFTLEVWGRDAEFMSSYISKGTRIGVSGSLVIDQYMSKQTNEMVTKTKILVKEFDVLESKAEAERRKEKQQQGGNSYYNSGGYNNNYKSSNRSYGGYNKGGQQPSLSDVYGETDDGFGAAGTGGFFD